MIGFSPTAVSAVPAVPVVLSFSLTGGGGAVVDLVGWTMTARFPWSDQA